MQPAPVRSYTNTPAHLPTTYQPFLTLLPACLHTDLHSCIPSSPHANMVRKFASCIHMDIHARIVCLGILPCQPAYLDTWRGGTCPCERKVCSAYCQVVLPDATVHCIALHCIALCFMAVTWHVCSNTQMPENAHLHRFCISMPTFWLADMLIFVQQGGAICHMAILRRGIGVPPFCICCLSLFSRPELMRLLHVYLIMFLTCNLIDSNII